MKNYLKRIIATVLCIVMVLCFVPNIKANAVTQSFVTNQLNTMINQYANRTATSSQMYMGSQCKGFANWVFKQLFGVYIGPYPESANYKISNAGAQLVGMISPGNLTEATSKALLQKAMPGDYIQVQRSIAKSGGKCGPHSMIVVAVKSDGVQVFDCNSDGKNTIKTYLYTWSKFDYDNRGMSLYHAYNYEADSSQSASDGYSTDYAGNYVVTTSQYSLNMRSGPSTGYSIVTTIPKNATVYVEKANGSWAYVSYGGYHGYCSMEYLKRVEQTSTLPETNLHAWFSADKMGAEASNVKLGENLYLCFRVETKDGNLLDSSIGNYSVKETIYYPNGESFPYTYGKSNNNWISSQLTQWGTYRGVVEISGDYTGKVEVSYTVTKPEEMVLETWFSKTAMGEKVSYLEKGQDYYLCYAIICDQTKYFNQFANVEYSVTQELYSPDGEKVGGHTYIKSDKNWIKFTVTQTGTYKGVSSIKGYFDASDTETITSKDTSIPKLQRIEITTAPSKISYIVGEEIDTSGMVVTAYYSDKSHKVITNYSIQANTKTAGNKYVVVSYTENGITSKDSYLISVKEKEKESVSITYDPAGGKMSRTSQSVLKNSTANLLTEKPKKTIWISFDTNGAISKIDSTEVQQEFIDWSYTKDGVVKHFKSGAAVYVWESSLLVANYEPAKISSLPVVEKDGYTFEGWYTSDGSKVYEGMELTDDTELIAHWKKNQEVVTDDETSLQDNRITITYNSCGGDWQEQTQEVEKDQPIVLLSGQPNRSYWITLDAAGGYISQSKVEVSAPFSGWFKNMNGSGQVYASGSTQCFSEDTTLYAGYGNARIGTLPSPSKEGYRFVGWYTLTGDKVVSDTLISADCVLVARWDEISSELIQDDSSRNDLSNDTSNGNEDSNTNGELDTNGEQNTDDEQLVYDEPDEEEEEPLQVGDEIVTDHAIYTITKLGASPSVELTEYFDDDTTNVIIPDTIGKDGVVYRVTSIASKAFYKNTSIKKVSIGNNVTKIGSKAFYGCKSLKNIVILSEKIKSGKIGTSAFSKVYKTVKVFIPSKKYSTYKKMLKKAGIGSKAKIYKIL